MVGCSTEDKNVIKVFLNAKFNLDSAAFNNSYKVDSEPAYFSKIPDSTQCLNLFDKENSYCSYTVEVVNNEPIGHGEINVSFADKQKDDFNVNFNYYVNYDRSYGGRIYVEDPSEIAEIKTQYCRGKYWWIRMECKFEQLNQRRAILEFKVSESFDDLTDFEGNTILSLR